MRHCPPVVMRIPRILRMVSPLGQRACRRAPRAMNVISASVFLKDTTPVYHRGTQALAKQNGWWLFQARVQCVAQPITEKVKAQHGNENGETRAQRQPSILLNPRHIGFQVPAPTRGWWLNTKP